MTTEYTVVNSKPPPIELTSLLGERKAEIIVAIGTTATTIKLLQDGAATFPDLITENIPIRKLRTTAMFNKAIFENNILTSGDGMMNIGRRIRNANKIK